MKLNEVFAKKTYRHRRLDILIPYADRVIEDVLRNHNGDIPKNVQQALSDILTDEWKRRPNMRGKTLGPVSSIIDGYSLYR